MIYRKYQENNALKDVDVTNKSTWFNKAIVNIVTADKVHTKHCLFFVSELGKSSTKSEGTERERPFVGKENQPIILMNDNVGPHTIESTKKVATNNGWNIFA